MNQTVKLYCQHGQPQWVARFEYAQRRQDEGGRFIDPPIYGVSLTSAGDQGAHAWHQMEMEPPARIRRRTPQPEDPTGLRAAGEEYTGDERRPVVVEVEAGQVTWRARRALTARKLETGEHGYMWAWDHESEPRDLSAWPPEGGHRVTYLRCSRCGNAVAAQCEKLTRVLDDLAAAGRREYSLGELRGDLAAMV